MQTTQIGNMETISAVVPQKGNVSTRSSDSPEDFGSKLHRDMLAADASSPGTGPAKERATSEIAQPTEKLTKPSTDADKGDPAPRPAQETQATENFSPKPAKPAIVAGPGGGAAISPPIEGPDQPATPPATKVEAAIVLPVKGEAAATPATKFSSPSVKRTAKTSSADNSSAAPPIVSSSAVQVDIPAGVLPVNARQKLTAETSLGAPSLAPAATPHPPSTILDQPTFAPPVPIEADGLPSGPVKQVSPTSALPLKSAHGANSALAELGTSATGTPANIAVASSIASNIHPQAVTLNAAVQAPAPVSPASSFARADFQPNAATAAGAAGIGTVHILPSGPTQLDVGVLDGTHGWLRIRAELGAGGGVSASLTASPLAHESLNAALPEMAKYLGSEAVAVTKLVVHSFSEGPDKMAFGAEANQQNGSAHEHHPGGENVLGGRDAPRQDASATDQHETAAAANMSSPTPPPSSAVSATISGRQIPEFTHTASPSQWPFAGPEVFSGNWLNVCA